MFAVNYSNILLPSEIIKLIVVTMRNDGSLDGKYRECNLICIFKYRFSSGDAAL